MCIRDRFDCLLEASLDITGGIKSIRLTSKLKSSNKKLALLNDQALRAMAKVVETKDPYVFGHQERVAQLSIAIASEMQLDKKTIDNIGLAAFIHDIGKISVPSELLSKPGRLTDIELTLIKKHVNSSFDILTETHFPERICRIVLQHHERNDGSGYPNGLKAAEILLEAKIIGVADVIEAMSSHRPYRAALGIDVALDEISKNKGMLYDSKVVDACVNLFREKGFEFK